MIELRPFRALRPPRDKAYLVATRSYLSYDDNELADKLQNNPYTFLHVINPPHSQMLPPGPEKYRMVKQRFDEFAEEGVFQRDQQPAYYLYRQVKEGNEYMGIIAAVAVADYEAGRIKKHEKTLSHREEMFTDYLETTGFNAEPVLLVYQDDHQLNQLMVEITSQRSEYEFTSTDRVLHQLWLVDQPEQCAQITERFAAQSELYIADGHHRCASSALLGARLDAQAQGQGDQHRYFMAFLIGEEQMKIYDFNRLVRNDTGREKAEILRLLQEQFWLEPKAQEAYRPQKLHELSMYLEGEWFKLVPKTGSFDPNHSVGHLDAEILSRNILAPIFDIQDLKTDYRVDFMPGTEGLEALARQVDKGRFDLAFALYPVSMAQLKQVSDDGETMPPKSTYVEPKLRSGMVVYPLREVD